MSERVRRPLESESRRVPRKVQETAAAQEHPQPNGKGNGHAAPATIAKPSGGGMDRFRSKNTASIGNVETLQSALPHFKISEAKDFVRLHLDEDKFWSPELCFVSVPIHGQKRDTLHLIEEEVALRNLPAAKILRFRLALATKPHDVFFLCHVPTRNLENPWNETSLEACERAKSHWTQVYSRKEEGVEAYKIEVARDADAFPAPKWPKQTLDELIVVTFEGRMISDDDHPGLLRLTGRRQAIS